jgi:hypothetical protein
VGLVVGQARLGQSGLARAGDSPQELGLGSGAACRRNAYDDKPLDWPHVHHVDLRQENRRQ